MLRRITLFLVCMLILPLAVHPAKADGMPTEEFSYTVDFQKTDPVQFWLGSKNYILNFKGLTDENCTPGRKCFKLDLTFGENSILYWKIPMPKSIPAEGSLKFSGSVFLGKETTAGRIELGPTFSYPPSSVKDTTPNVCRVSSKGKWLPMQDDLAATAKKNANMAKYNWGDPDISNVCSYLDGMVIRLYGNKGDRVVIYLDDFHITGEIPVSSAYIGEAEKRWQPIKEKLAKKIGEWERVLNLNTKALADIDAKTEAAVKLKKETLAKVSELKMLIAQTKKRNVLLITNARKIDAGVKWLGETRYILPMLASLGNAELAITIVNPISSNPILPSGWYGNPGNNISMTAARGEYEPASFVVHAMRDTKALTVTVGDLKQGSHVIPASAIDIKAVKCWYQAGTAWYAITQDKSRRVLVPELLLNDDSLVKVDMEKKENYLKLKFPNGEKYAWISDPDESAATAKKNMSIKEFPVKDSPALLPVDIPADENKQFWITVKVPENAAPGTYNGKIRLTSTGEDNADITLTLKVLPFKLSEPYYDSSIYYIGRLDPEGVGSIASRMKSKTQFAAELRNMVAHGVTKPILYQGFNDKELLKECLAMRQSAGMSNDPLYYRGFGADSDINLVREFLDFTGKNSIKEVYFYGLCEARGEKLIAQRESWTNIRNAGGKVFVAGSKDENFEKMGDIQDLLVCAFRPNKEEVDKWHSLHHKIWCYANPQGGVENPEIYRRNYGLFLWQNNYDGACTFAYQFDLSDVWNDFDHKTYRDHNFTYPTVDGVIDTIAWEGYREGVDDVRYLTTLVEAVKSAKASKDSSKIKAVQSAEKYLAELKTADLSTRDLSTVRSEIVRHILEVTK